MIDPQDYWTSDDFEDFVAAALIACFETKVKKNHGAAPADRMSDERVALMRSTGPYIASNSRFLIGPDEISGAWDFDTVNDPLPLSGLIAFRPSKIHLVDRPGAYLILNYIRKAQALGRYWHKRRGGVLYEMFSADAGADGINGDRRFFTVTKTGEVVSCTQQIASVKHSTQFGERKATIGPDAKWLQETQSWGAIALQILADRRFCWSISAQEKSARAHLGCMKEEVKSLLYARTLPMTSTGRKRPILHLVEAHKRRIRSGTDVDINAFLRGQQVVEFGGTVFRVNPPQTLRSVVSTASARRYFENQA